MSDIDILIDAENMYKMENIMLSMEYVKTKGAPHHDAYFKVPVMNIEIHKQLFSSESNYDLNEYYKDTFMKSKKIDGYKYIYKMTDEEFYIYILSHLYKHYCHGGSGIRSVIDVYVLNHGIYEKLNKQSLTNKLEHLNMLDFRNQITNLSEMWFDKNDETPELTKLSEYIIGSGTYGTISNFINNQIKEKGRKEYFIYCIFLPLCEMKVKYPILNKAPFLLSVFWIWRLISALTTKRNVVMLKLRVIFQKTKI